MQVNCWKIILLALCLNVYHAETILSSLRVEATRDGDRIILTCSIIGDEYKTSALKWERPLGNVIAYGPELVLRNVPDEDVSKYICTVKSTDLGIINTKTQDTNEFIQEVIEDAKVQSPQIFVPQAPQGIIKLQETQNLNMECLVENWRIEEYNAQWIKPNGYVASESSKLYVESITKKDHEGIYFCNIIHKTQNYQIFNRKIEVIINKPTVAVEILAGEKLQISGLINRKCVGFKLENSSEKFSYKWMDSQGRIVSTTDTIQVPINDPTMFGVYECHYIAMKSGETYISKITVSEDKYESKSTSYFISVTPYPKHFQLKEKFSIRCQVVPELKDIKYTWYKNNELLAENQQTLVFESFTRANLGSYKCKATGYNEQNVLVELEARSDQKLTVFSAVKVELIEGAGSQVAVHLSKKKELHCDISPDSDNSGAEVKWTFESKDLSTQQSLDNYNVSRVNGRLMSILVLNNAQLENEGHYQCIVGSVTKSVNIIVIQDESLLIINPEILKRFEDQPAEFHCRINDIPNLKNMNISWYFIKKDGSARIAIPDERWKASTQQIADRTSFISIDSVDMKDNGYYICTIPIGLESQAELVVEERLRPFVARAIPPVINVSIRQKFQFECSLQDRYGNPNGEPIIKFFNGSLVSNDSRFNIIKLSPSRIKLLAPYGVNIHDPQLKMLCGVDEKFTVVNINVRQMCPPNYRYCRSSECMSNNKFCNGVVDCADGSDEDVSYCNSCDPISKPCGLIQGNSTSRNYYSINWKCDGEVDCDNGFDEENCDASAKCNTNIFICNNGFKIPYSYICDGRDDCYGGEDETGCSKPTILSTSQRKTTAKSGSTIEFRCVVRSYPMSTIIWRYNWNCLPDEGRMTIRQFSDDCRKVTSILTITNVQAGDDAIYNCEAISNRNRALSEPFQVVIEM